MTTQDYFEGLRAELVAATARENAMGERSKPRRRRHRWTWLVAAALALPAGAAATGAWQPFTEGDGLVRLSPSETVASGVLSSGGTSQLVRSDSSAGPCLELVIVDGPPEQSGLSGGCGSPEGAIASVGANGRSSGILFGDLPRGAHTVTYFAPAPSRSAVSAPVVARGTERYYLMEVDRLSTDGCLIARDARGATVMARSVSDASRAPCPRRSP